MSNDDIPRLPDDRLQLPDRLLRDLNPGEKVVLTSIVDIRVDEESRAWINGELPTSKMPLVPRMTLQAERTAAGFILWLDKKVKFKPQSFSNRGSWLPVVEFAKHGRRN